MTIISNVPTATLIAIDAKFAKLTKRAEKCGAEAPAYKVTAIRYIKEKDHLGDPTGRVIEVCDLRPYGAATQIDGYDFIGVIDTSSFSENLVKAAPGVDFPPHLRDSKPVCDHCGLNRNRNDIVVLRSPEGDYIRLGRSCANLYFPNGDPESAILAAAFYAELVKASEERESYKSAEYLTIDILGVAAAAVRQFGFVSKAAAAEDFGKESTCSVVEGHYSRDPKGRVETSAADFDKAKTVIAWAGGINADYGLGDYGESLRVVCSSEIAPIKYWGILVSAITAYDRWVAKEARKSREAATKAASEWVGDIKKRQDFNVTCERVISIEGHYGVTGLHILRDEAGNTIKWFASESTKWLEEGNTATIKATVKAHEEYEGEKQTIVSRAKIIETLSEAA